MIFLRERAALETPGRPYRPSNNTEMDLFVHVQCGGCTRDQKTCPIIPVVMLYDESDAKYPADWVISESGQPMCAAFTPMNQPAEPTGNTSTEPDDTGPRIPALGGDIWPILGDVL
ncbi:MAG: hypothetical protein AAFS03_02400 [Pseudomonadota bacterium]